MDLSSNINLLVNTISESKPSIATEEATKQAFILPFFQKLGFDVFNPNVFVPEFTADIGTKKNEKVDYAIFKDKKPFILIEAKHHEQKLDNHHNQLVRYFNVVDCKFAVLTNGVEYRFFSDLDKENIMDKAPFLTIDLLNLKERDLKELEKFTADNIDSENILKLANQRKYVSLVKDIFKKETIDPSDSIIRLFASQMTDKKLTQGVIAEFKSYVKQAFSEVSYDLASDRLNNIKSELSINSTSNIENLETEENKIITTEEELEGFFIIKSILAEKCSLSRIHQRDNQSYFAILLDDNNRKWIARLYFNTKQKYLSLHISDKQEEKFAIDNVEDIYKYKNNLLEVLNRII